MSRGPFLSLLNGYSISARSLARVAGVRVETIEAVMWEIAEVDPETAEKVITAFHRMTQMQWTREQLGIHIVAEEK